MCDFAAIFGVLVLPALQVGLPEPESRPKSTLAKFSKKYVTN
jgi:hypothetical protein